MKIAISTLITISFVLFTSSLSFAGGMEELNEASVSTDASKERSMKEMGKEEMSIKDDGMVDRSMKASAETGSISDFELAKYQYCGSDSDCVVATNGCCDCANGSPDVSINKNRLQAFQSNFSCSTIRCGEQDAYPRCGSGVVSCISHRCEYIEP